MNQITIKSLNGAGVIPPELHGQFIEFLGSCISDGIWAFRTQTESGGTFWTRWSACARP